MVGALAAPTLIGATGRRGSPSSGPQSHVVRPAPSPQPVHVTGHAQLDFSDFDKPLDKPAVDWGGLKKLEASVAAADPKPDFVVVDHLKSVTL